MLETVLTQNIEPDPDGDGSKIIKGVAADRRTHGKYGKKNFKIDLQNLIVTCPAGNEQSSSAYIFLRRLFSSSSSLNVTSWGYPCRHI